MDDPTTTVITVQSIAWGVAALAWRRIDINHSPRWIVLNMYGSTALLGASALCHALVLLYGARALAWSISWLVVGMVVSYMVAAALYWLLHTRVTSGPSVGPLRADTQRAAVNRSGGWTIRDVEPTQVTAPAVTQSRSARTQQALRRATA